KTSRLRVVFFFSWYTLFQRVRGIPPTFFFPKKKKRRVPPKKKRAPGQKVLETQLHLQTPTRLQTPKTQHEKEFRVFVFFVVSGFAERGRRKKHENFPCTAPHLTMRRDRKSTRLNSSHSQI